ncbi:hypothetical protein IC006_1779 [Sulfuracidifex tepidarius]|uniref:Uncharacterized protein n=2 Tax=Sulfuracidifex tepidarius TaxID=1294262 RepID=A0A510E596_9CREN|nr:hypothetical protein IC006_1779 [Sulfuracidifex tepidarius]BBG27218.1 hypothetical protein IC007_1757 [Sulfuracidifex tepidarius]
MPKFVFEGPLVSFFGKSLIAEDGSLFEILSRLDKSKVILDSSGRIRPGILVLLNGKDIRLFGKTLNEKILSGNDEVRFIPVNHGG